MKIILLGKPMSGKGTQAKRLAEKLELKHISTGDLLRAEVKNETELGKEVKSLLDKGQLVPDETIIKLLKKNMPEDGFILDGFPRTVPQAEALENITNIEHVVEVACSDEIIVKRTVMRRICKGCGAIYGLDVPPKTEGVCDKCQGELYQRSDDNEETIKDRLDVYNKQTSPLVEYYKGKGLYVQVDGEAPIGEVTGSIVKIVK